MKKLRVALLLALPFSLSACGNADLDTVLEDLGNLDKLFKSEERQGVQVTKGYPQPELQSDETASNKKSKRNQRKRSSKDKMPLTTTVVTKRLNTAQCTEPDDWYLDGYRVGKSFTAQKNAMYAQRVNYCRGQISNVHQYRQNWESGFRYGKKA